VHPLIALLAAEDKNPLLPSANELIYGTIAFLIVFAVLAKYVFPRINAALASRSGKIQGDLEQAELDRQEANRLLEEYRQQLTAAREESNRIMEEAKKNAEQARKDLIARAEADANRVVARAQEEIRAERNRAIAEVRSETASLALGLAGKVIGETLDDERHRRLIDRYIEELPRGEG